MSEVSLGPGVRRLREEQRLSLRALAQRTGFSASFLSQVENGQASPSIASMERIASALGVTLGEFFQSVGAVPNHVTRADARPTLQSGWSRARIEALGAASDGTRLETVLVTLEPGGSSGSKVHASPREEFALIMEGTIELTLAAAEQTLVAGDAVTIPTGTMRRWFNTGKQPVRLLIVSAR